jgi:uncharacterized protein
MTSDGTLALPRSTWAAWPWGLLLATALVLPTLATWLYFYAMAGTETVRWIYTGSKFVQFALVLPWFAARKREHAAQGGTADRARWPWWTGAEIGVAFGLAVVLLGVALYVGVLRDSALMIPAAAQIRGKLADMGVATPAGYLAMAVFLSGIHSLLEEFYWRWFVYGGLRRMTPDGAALATSSLGFMAHHVLVLAAFFPGQWSWVAVFSLSVAVGGAAWAWLYRKSGSLLGPWLSHLVVDAGVMAIGYDLAFRG